MYRRTCKLCGCACLKIAINSTTHRCYFYSVIFFSLSRFTCGTPRIWLLFMCQLYVKISSFALLFIHLSAFNSTAQRRLCRQATEWKTQANRINTRMFIFIWMWEWFIFKSLWKFNITWNVISKENPIILSFTQMFYGALQQEASHYWATTILDACMCTCNVL